MAQARRGASATSDDPWRLRDALAGDESAWVAIVDEFLPTVWHWARSCGLTRTQAEDVSQIVWYRLQDVGDRIKEPARLAGWLATTTRREAIAVRRRAERIVGLDLDSWLGNDDPVPFNTNRSPEALVMLGETRDRLQQAYSSLGPSCRELLSLCWDDSLSHEEIAAILKRPVGSIGPTRRRCLDKLRKEAGLDE